MGEGSDRIMDREGRGGEALNSSAMRDRQRAIQVPAACCPCLLPLVVFVSPAASLWCHGIKRVLSSGSLLLLRGS